MFICITQQAFWLQHSPMGVVGIKTLFLLLISSGCLMWHQDDFKTKLERAEVHWYDPNMFENVKVSFYIYNRSLETKLINASGELLRDTPNRIMFHAQVYKFSSMEYRLFPINFSMDACKELSRNSFGTNNIWASTDRPCCCPFKKGTFYLKNYLIDFSKLPPHAPTGRFKVVITLYIYDNVKIGNGSAYYEVETVIRWAK